MFDLGAGHRLVIGNDRQGFHGDPGQSPRRLDHLAQPGGQIQGGAEHHALARIHQLDAALGIAGSQRRQHGVGVDIVRQYPGQSARGDRFGTGEDQGLGQPQGVLIGLT
jgi:hypothetical protein